MPAVGTIRWKNCRRIGVKINYTVNPAFLLNLRPEPADRICEYTVTTVYVCLNFTPVPVSSADYDCI
jgi:hypothetical protein